MNIKKILENHKLWLEDKEGGEKANLRSADLSSAGLRCADLRFADLSSADLRYADLRSANLRSADLSSADLSYADLRSADLSYADLRFANLSYADLRFADLRSANLSSADLITFQYNRDVAYYQFDGKIRIGCEYHGVNHWAENYKAIGKKAGYEEIEIEVYGNFITTCEMLDRSKE